MIMDTVTLLLTVVSNQAKHWIRQVFKLSSIFATTEAITEKRALLDSNMLVLDDSETNCKSAEG